MNSWIRRSIWFSRFVLGGSALLMTRVGLASVLDPLGEAARHRMTLGAPDAITIMRVQGAIFVGIAVALLACVVSERRLLMGLGFLASVLVAVTAARLLGLAVDGPGPFTLMVLKPEIVLVVLSTLAFLLERNRSRGITSGGSRPTPMGGLWHPNS